MNELHAPQQSRFFENIVDSLGSLLGDKAGRAALSYAATEEGKRVAKGYAKDQVPALLERLDAMLDQKSTLIQEKNPFIIHIRNSRFLEDEGGMLADVCLSVIEGACMRMCGGVVHAKVIDRLSDGTRVVEVKNA